MLRSQLPALPHPCSRTVLPQKTLTQEAEPPRSEAAPGLPHGGVPSPAEPPRPCWPLGRSGEPGLWPEQAVRGVDVGVQPHLLCGQGSPRRVSAPQEGPRDAQRGGDGPGWGHRPHSNGLPEGAACPQQGPPGQGGSILLPPPAWPPRFGCRAEGLVACPLGGLNSAIEGVVPSLPSSSGFPLALPGG